MSRFFLISFIFSLSVFITYAQKNIPLTDKLAEIATKEEIKFSFDPDLLRGIEVSASIGSLADLELLFSKSALKLTSEGSENYMISPSPTLFTFQLPKGEISEYHLDIVDAKNRILFQDFIIDKESVSFEWIPTRDTIKIISSAHDPIKYSSSSLLLNPTVELPLKEKISYLDDVIVKDYLTSSINLNVSNQTTSILVQDMAFTPGETDGDILAALATLPGVNTPDSRPGNIFIHNSPSDQNLVLYNQIPIYHKGHYFGSISPYNPAMVEEVTIYKNGFHPRLGNRVGGAIEIEEAKELKNFKKYGGGINTLYGNAYVKHNFSNKVGIALGVRHSTPNNWWSPKLDEITDVVYDGTILTSDDFGGTLESVDVNFSDYSFNALVSPNESNEFHFSSVYTSNFTEYQVDTSDVSTKESIVFDNLGMSFIWKNKINEKLTGKLTSVFSDYETSFDSEGFDRRESDVVSEEVAMNSIEDISLGYEINLKGKKNNDWSFGLESKRLKLIFDHEVEVSRNSKDEESFSENKVFTHSLFGNYDFKSAEKLYFQIGARATYYDEQDRAFLSPRLLANYDVTDHLIAKGSFGRYYQFLSQVKYLEFGNSGFYNELWRVADEEEIKVVSSNQWMLGGIMNKGKWVVEAELYGKKIDDVNYSSTISLESQTEFHSADWSIIGVDLFTKYQISDHLLLWNSYEFGKASLSFDSLSSVEYPYKYTRPHQLKLGGLYTKDRWKISGFYKLASGMYARSIDILIYEEYLLESQNFGGNTTNNNVQILSTIPDRYPVYSAFDVFITYEIPKTLRRKFNLRFGLSLMNLFNRDNQIDAVVRGDDNEIDDIDIGDDNLFLLEREGMGFAPNLDISISW